MAAQEPQRRSPAAPAQHLGSHIRGVAQASVDVHRAANVSGLNGLLGVGEGRVAAVVKINHQLDASVFDGGQDGLRIFNRGGQGFFDQDVLAGPRGGNGNVAMSEVWRGD